MAQEHPDFADEINILPKDIQKFAMPGIGLPEGFQSLKLLKELPTEEKINSLKEGEAFYILQLQLSNETRKIGDFSLLKTKDLIINGQNLENCWERLIFMEKPLENETNYGKQGFTRAAIKCLTEEANRVGITDISAFVRQENTASLKMGQAVGWGEIVENYEYPSKENYQNWHLFHATVDNVLSTLNRYENGVMQPIKKESALNIPIATDAVHNTTTNKVTTPTRPTSLDIKLATSKSDNQSATKTIHRSSERN